MLNSPKGLSIDALGDVWVADAFNKRIVEFDNTGSHVLSTFRPTLADGETPLLVGPQDVYIDGYGSIYITDQGVTATGSYRFVRLGPDGTFLGAYPAPTDPGSLFLPSKISVGSFAYGGDVFINDVFSEPDYRGVGGAVERWALAPLNRDTTPPTTEISQESTADVVSGWYHNSVTVSLSASDVGWGVSVTKWGYSPSSLTTYTAPFVINAEGDTPIYYQSTDRAGLVEPMQSSDVLIDHSAPVTTAPHGRLARPSPRRRTERTPSTGTRSTMRATARRPAPPPTRCCPAPSKTTCESRCCPAGHR